MPDNLHIPGSSADARAVRTRDAVANALVALMRIRPYDEISVQDVCERANVGRSTFYAQFQDKDDVFIRQAIMRARDWGERLVWDGQSYRFPVGGFFEHVWEVRAVFESLAKARKREFILRVTQNNIAEVFEARIREARVGASAPIPAPVLAQHLAGALMNLLTWWLDHHRPLQAPDMEQNWGRLVAGLR